MDARWYRCIWCMCWLGSQAGQWQSPRPWQNHHGFSPRLLRIRCPPACPTARTVAVRLLAWKANRQNQSEELNYSEVQNLSLGWIILGSKPNSVSKSIITFWQCNLGNCPKQFLKFLNKVDDLPNKFGEFPLPRKITWRCPQHQTTSFCLSQQDSFTNQPAGLQDYKSTESESPYIINMYLPPYDVIWLYTIYIIIYTYYIYIWLYEVIKDKTQPFL